jgi:hypothetical protein
VRRERLIVPTFKDNNGKEWTVTLDGPKIREVRRDCDGLNLAATDGSACHMMEADPLLMFDALWVLCKEQADKAGVDSPTFYAALTGDATDRGLEALNSAIADFFPSRKRTLLASLLSKQQEVTEKGMALAMARLNDPSLSERLLAKLTKEIDEKLSALIQSDSVTNGQASSE